MLLGIWKNIEELESSICLDELYGILAAASRREHRQNKFQALLHKGVDIDASGDNDPQKAFERAQARAAARLSGKSVDEVELSTFGIDVEVE